MARMDGKVVIVTGGARGLGGAAVSALAAEGARVIIADILTDVGEAKAAAVREAGGTALFQQLDVRDADSWSAVVEKTLTEYGGIDALVNNAGIALPQTIEGATLEDFRRVMDVNLYGPFLGIQAVLPTMIERGSGSIVNVSSNSTEMIVPTTTYYAASKAALANLTKTTAVHFGLKGYNIRSNSIHPGPHNTEMISNPEVAKMPHIQQMRETVPLGRFGESEGFGHLVVFLASDESSYITAQEFFIDGGLTRVSYPSPRG